MDTPCDFTFSTVISALYNAKNTERDVITDLWLDLAILLLVSEESF